MKDIGLGIICPSHYLGDFAVQSPYHLVLTHKVFEDPVYRDFYKERSDMGEFITLDNSSYEVGDGVYTEKDLYEAAQLVGAHEIMAPEEYLSSKLTYHKVAAFVEFFQRKFLKVNIFATLHGKTMNDIAWLNRKFIQLKVATIGVSCRLDPINFGIDHPNEAFRKSFSRMRIVNNLGAEWRVSYHKPQYHMLGMNHPAEIMYYQKNPMVRSIDSSAAFINGTLLRSIDQFDYVKPPEKLDFDLDRMTEEQLNMVGHNIQLLKKWGARNDS
ncbi:MAG: hypothetical protein ACYTBJ_00770 [Planctomycetota bacterium]|jgi:hypothetical protein